MKEKSGHVAAVVLSFLLLMTLAGGISFAEGESGIFFQRQGKEELVDREKRAKTDEEGYIDLGYQENLPKDKVWRIRFSRAVEIEEILSVTFRSENQEVSAQLEKGLSEDTIRAVSTEKYLADTLYELKIVLKNGRKYKKSFRTAREDRSFTEERAQIAREVCRLVNAYRKEQGLRELSVNRELQEYADIRAFEIQRYFAHTRPDGSPAGSGWHNSQNLINTRYAENIFYFIGYPRRPKELAERIFEFWKESPGHNFHMLYPFSDKITMAAGIDIEMQEDGFVSLRAVRAGGY